jgi:hypothetical protein
LTSTGVSVNIPEFAINPAPEFPSYLAIAKLPNTVCNIGGHVFPKNGAPAVGTWLPKLPAFLTNDRTELLAGLVTYQNTL